MRLRTRTARGPLAGGDSRGRASGSGGGREGAASQAEAGVTSSWRASEAPGPRGRRHWVKPASEPQAVRTTFKLEVRGREPHRPPAGGRLGLAKSYDHRAAVPVIECR
eukprot:3721871-Rhodomonas_salina.1